MLSIFAKIGSTFSINSCKFYYARLVERGLFCNMNKDVCWARVTQLDRKWKLLSEIKYQTRIKKLPNWPHKRLGVTLTGGEGLGMDSQTMLKQYKHLYQLLCSRRMWYCTTKSGITKLHDKQWRYKMTKQSNNCSGGWWWCYEVEMLQKYRQATA